MSTPWRYIWWVSFNWEFSRNPTSCLFNVVSPATVPGFFLVNQTVLWPTSVVQETHYTLILFDGAFVSFGQSSSAKQQIAMFKPMTAERSPEFED